MSKWAEPICHLLSQSMICTRKFSVWSLSSWPLSTVMKVLSLLAWREAPPDWAHSTVNPLENSCCSLLTLVLGGAPREPNEVPGMEVSTVVGKHYPHQYPHMMQDWSTLYTSVSQPFQCSLVQFLKLWWSLNMKLFCCYFMTVVFFTVMNFNVNNLEREVFQSGSWPTCWQPLLWTALVLRRWLL